MRGAQKYHSVFCLIGPPIVAEASQMSATWLTAVRPRASRDESRLLLCQALLVKRPEVLPCTVLLPDLGTLLIVPPAARLSAIPPPVSTTVCATMAELVM